MNFFRTTWRYLLRGIALSVLCVLGLLGFCAWQVYFYAKPQPEMRADVAIVLGAAAWGEKPSPVFRERINHALGLYQSHHVQKLIFTGGTPKTGYPSEAEVARKFAIKQGINSDDIAFETTSKDTFQNLVNARELMRRHKWQTAVLVSDPYHMARARAIARDLGLNVALSPTPTSRFLQADKETQQKFFLQETYALFVYRLLYWGNRALKWLPFTI